MKYISKLYVDIFHILISLWICFYNFYERTVEWDIISKIGEKLWLSNYHWGNGVLIFFRVSVFPTGIEKLPKTKLSSLRCSQEQISLLPD